MKNVKTLSVRIEEYFFDQEIDFICNIPQDTDSLGIRLSELSHSQILFHMNFASDFPSKTHLEVLPAVLKFLLDDANLGDSELDISVMNYGAMISDIDFPPTSEIIQVFYWGDIERISLLEDAVNCAILRHTEADERGYFVLGLARIRTVLNSMIDDTLVT